MLLRDGTTRCLGLSDREACEALSAVTFGVNEWSRVRTAQSMNDRRELIVRACGGRAWTHGWAFLLCGPFPEHLVLVVYVLPRWRPIRIAYESSPAPCVRFASIVLAAVGMSQCDSVC